MKFCRTILNISYVNCITIDVVWDTIREETSHLGAFIISTVKKRMLKWYRDVITDNNLSTDILQGSILDKRRRSRQEKWFDNVPEWAGRSFIETEILARNRDIWRELVRCSDHETDDDDYDDDNDDSMDVVYDYCVNFIKLLSYRLGIFFIYSVETINVVWNQSFRTKGNLWGLVPSFKTD